MIRHPRPLATALLLLATACGPEAPATGDSVETATTADQAASAPGVAARDGALPSILVYKTEGCGCCNGWVDHLESQGFTVEARNVTDLMSIKRDAGVPASNASCHTALVDGYVVEGHVPADVVKRLLAERPEVTGIAVPGMPMGSPGMEGPNPEPYQVLTFDRQGANTVYTTVDPR